MVGIVVGLSWTCFAAAAVRRRCMQLRPTSDDDADDSSASFPRTFLAVVVMTDWECRRMDGASVGTGLVAMNLYSSSGKVGQDGD
jgi:hypothetical protein